MKFEIEYIEKLAKIIADNELTEISLEDGEQAITIRKDLAEVVTTAAPVAAAPAPVVCQTTVNPAVVEVGKTISEGDVVCIVEAMKLMNEIKAEHSGKVTQICVKNGDPVEFGQVLMYVE